MHMDYDPDARALYITLRDTAPSFGEDVSPGVIGHYDASGRLVGIELLDVTWTGIANATQHLTIPDPAPTASA